MKLIRSHNSIVELLETNDQNELTQSLGFNFGELFFKIINKKVSFYLRQPDAPFSTMVWSCNIPLLIDDILYETEDEVSAALGALMIDQYQLELDKMNEKLQNESDRAKDVETRIDSKLDNEIQRSTREDDRFEDFLVATSALLATYDVRISGAEDDANYAVSAITTEVAARITGDNALQDAVDALEDELDEKLNVADFNAYSSDTKDAIDEKLAIDDFNTYSAATKDAIDGKLETSDFNAYSATTDDKIDTKLGIDDFQTYSGEVDTEIDGKLETSDFNAYSADTASEIDSKVATSDFQTFSGEVASELQEKLSEAVFQTYSATMETEIQTISSSTTSDVTILSGDVATLSADIESLTDALTAHTNNSDIHITSAERTAWNAKSDFSGSYNDLTDKLSAGTNVTIVDNVISVNGDVDSGQVQTMIDASLVDYYDKSEVDDMFVAIEVSGGSFQPLLYYTKTETNTLLDDKLDISAYTPVDLSNYYQKNETSSKTEIADALNNIDLSDYYKKNETSSKTEIDTAIAVKVSQSDFQSYSGAVASEMSGKASQSDLSGHTSNNDIHVTSADKTNWNAKPDVWIGDATAWSEISGSTENGVIYLVY